MAKKIRVYQLSEANVLYGGKGQFFHKEFKYTKREIPAHLTDYFEPAGSMTKEELGDRPFMEDESFDDTMVPIIPPEGGEPGVESDSGEEA